VKEDQRLKKQDHALCVQAQATTDLAAANALKAKKTIQDQAILSLFMMSKPNHLSKQAQQYLEIRRQEEMKKLKD